MSDTTAKRVSLLDRLADNPEIFRFVRSNLRLMMALMVLGGYFLFMCLITGIILMACWNPRTATFDNLDDAMKAFLFFLIVAEFIIFLAGGGLTASTLAAKEKESNTFELYQLTTYSRPWALFGRILGGTLIVYLVVQVTLPFVVLSATIGKVSAGPLIQLHILLFISGLFVHLYAFFLSILQKKTGAAQSLLIVTCIAYGIFSAVARYELHMEFMSLLNPVLYLFEIMEKLDTSRPPTLNLIPFMGWKIPTLTATFALYVYFAIWLWTVSVRKMKSLFAPWLSRKQLLTFLITFDVLLVGFLLPLGTFSTGESMMTFAIVNLILLILSVYVVLPNYVEYVDQKERSEPLFYFGDKGRTSYFYFLLAVPLGLLLFTGWPGFSFAWVKDFMLYSYCLVIYGMLYFSVIRFFRLYPFQGADAFGGFVIVLSLLLPFPAASMMGWKDSIEYAFILNPLGLLTKMFDAGNWDTLTSIPVLMNYVAPLVALVAMRFALAYREKAIAKTLKPR